MLTNHSSFILFDLIILQRPIGFLSIEISSVNIREIKLLVLPGVARLTEELCRAPRASWLTLPPDRLSVMAQPSAAAGFKMHSGFGLWISSLPSRCQTFARPLGPCLLAAHLCCVFSKLRYNHRLDSGSTGSLMQHKHLCEGDVFLSWDQGRVVIGSLLIFSVILHYAAVSFKREALQQVTFSNPLYPSSCTF